MLGFTVVTKMGKLGLVGNWIPMLKRLKSDYTCQICMYSAAQMQPRLRQDRQASAYSVHLMTMQRERFLECKNECKQYKCLH